MFRFGTLVILCTVLMIFHPGKSSAGVRLDLAQVDDKDLRTALETSFNYRDTLSQPADLATVVLEQKRMKKLIQGFGYIDGEVAIKGDVAGFPKTELTLVPIPGEVYRLGFVGQNGLTGPQAASIATLMRDVLSQYMGQVARADVIGIVRKQILLALQRASYPFATVSGGVFSPHRASHLAGFDVDIVMGEQMVFGDVLIQGDRGKLTADDLLPGIKGLPYAPDRIDQMEETLRASDKFRRVEVKLRPAANRPGFVNVVVTLRRKARSLEELWTTGLPGLIAILSAISLVTLRQILIAAGARTRRTYRLTMDAAVLGTVSVALYLAALRVLSFIS